MYLFTKKKKNEDSIFKHNLSYFVKALGFTHIYLVFFKLEEKPNCAYVKLPCWGNRYKLQQSHWVVYGQ